MSSPKISYFPCALLASTLVFFAALASGCAGLHPGAVRSGFDKQGNPLFLSSPQQHRLRVESFLREHPSPTEEEKIQYLLDGIRSSDYVFVRNRQRYSSIKAIGWLRWKRGHAQYRDDPILTSRDFVERVADISRATGWPYQMILPDNSWHQLQPILRNELNALEERLGSLNTKKGASPPAPPEALHEDNALLSQPSSRAP